MSSPIISILLLPSQLATYFSNSTNGVVKDVSLGLLSGLDPHSWLYAGLYFTLRLGFTYSHGLHLQAG